MRTFSGKFYYDSKPLIESHMVLILQSLLYGYRKANIIMNKSFRLVNMW